MARDTSARRACCLVSEILEEAGLDRDKARRLRRQLLQGVILFCQWQLERLEGGRPSGRPSGRPPRKRAQRVTLE